MQSPELTSAYAITTADEAAAFGDPVKRRAVLACAQTEKSASDIADAIAEPLKKTHYHLSRLVELGLIEVCGERPRGGRAIKLYKAAATSFFVPQHLLDEPQKQLKREMAERFAEARALMGGGVHFFIDDAGRMRMARVSEGEDRADLAERWLMLKLDKPRAAELREKIFALVKEAAETSDRQGDDYYFHLAMMRR